MDINRSLISLLVNRRGPSKFFSKEINNRTLICSYNNLQLHNMENWVFWSPCIPNANVHTHAHDYKKSSSCPSFTTATKLFITSAVAPQMSTHVDATRKSERYPENFCHLKKSLCSSFDCMNYSKDT